MRKLILSFASLIMLCGSAFADDTTLYDDLGGADGVDAIVAGMLDGARADARIGHTFAHSDMERLHAMLAEHLCEVTDGPCAYSGLTMKQAHRGLQLKPSDFTALVEQLQASMRDQDIPFRTQSRLIARLAPMRPNIVTPRAERLDNTRRMEAKRRERAARK